MLKAKKLVKQRPLLCSYRVTVETANVPGAGSTSNVTLYLTCEEQPNSPLALELSSDENDFKRGEINKFFVKALDLGRILSASIGHDNLGTSILRM